MFVKPAPGLSVRDPISKRHLPAEGRDVPESIFWLRRLAGGDVVLAESPMLQPVQIHDSEQDP